MDLQITEYDSLYQKAQQALDKGDHDRAEAFYHQLHEKYSQLLQLEIDDSNKEMAYACLTRIYDGLNAPKQNLLPKTNLVPLVALTLIVLIAGIALTLNPSIVGLAVYDQAPQVQSKAIQQKDLPSSVKPSERSIVLPYKTVDLFGPTTVELYQLFGKREPAMFTVTASTQSGISLYDHFLTIKPGGFRGKLTLTVTRTPLKQGAIKEKMDVDFLVK